MKKKYEVTIYYHTNVVVVVEASDEKEAEGLAYIEAGKSKYDEQILNNMQDDGAPDIEEVE